MNRSFTYMPVCLKAFFTLCVLVGLSACNKSGTDGNTPPKVSYVDLSGNLITAGSNSYIDLVFNFADKDGDLGNAANGMFDIYVVDSRNDSTIGYYFPKGIIGSSDEKEGISGNCTLSLFGNNMLLRPDRPDGDTLHYEVYIKDQKGHESNRLVTPDIYLIP